MRGRRIKRWNNVCDSISKEFEIKEGKVFDLYGKEIPALNGIKLPEYGEIIIGFSSSGYSDPGICSGPVERCYPPEGDEERTMEEVYISIPDSKQKIKLPLSVQEQVYAQYEEEVMEADLPEDRLEDPGYED